MRSALSMLLRRAHPAADQGELNQLIVARLPLVVALAADGAPPRVVSVGEFVRDAAGHLALHPRFARDAADNLVEVEP
ncbi:MAG: hypothetical protein M5R40_16005 [Anaerolineae bacterium]|nr:hypothetical protein [Anaerolineae bacterium]